MLFAARHVNTCISYTCKFLNPFVFHRENNIILDWNDVGVSKPWSFYSLVIIVLIIAHFGWKTWAIWAWPSVKSSGRHSRTDRLLALLWCCAVHFRFQAVDVWNALGPFRRPRRFSQSCEVQLPDVSDHRARRHKAAALAVLKERLSHESWVLRVTSSSQDAFMSDMKKLIALLQCF